jgi:putative ABC transport system permease protein
MPSYFTSQVADVQGVAATSPQLYVGSVAGSRYTDEGDLLVVAYDPHTDFTLGPWVKAGAAGDLAAGQAVAGSSVSVPPNGTLDLYGVPLTVHATLEPTGTDLDRSLFVDFETAYELARASHAAADGTLAAPRDEISAVMVKVAPGARPGRVAAAIRGDVEGAAPVASPEMFKTHRVQIAGLRRGLVAITTMTVVLSAALLALVFSLAAHQRRRQIGMLRALGATRGAVVRAFLTEAELLALGGGVLGVLVAAAGIGLFRAPLGDELGFPFSFPSAGKLALLIFAGLAVALAVVAVSALVPALRVARQEPATSMRE